MNRTEMRRCGKRYGSEDEASRSKAGLRDGVIPALCRDANCGGWHLPAAPKSATPIARTAPAVPVPAPRAAPGHMRAAVAMVLAQERSIVDAAREFEVDPGRLWDAAWTAAKKVVMDRDDYTCGACGQMAVDVQHRRRRGAGGTSDTAVSLGFSNLTAMCRADHDLADHGRDHELHARGFWLDRGQDPAEFPVFVLAEYGIEARYLLSNGTYTLTSPREAAS